MTISKIHKISKEVECCGHKLVFESLTYGDVMLLLEKMNALQSSNLSPELISMFINLINVSLHLKKIDDKELSFEQKKEFLESLSPEEMIELTKIVNEIAQEKEKLLEELKKNSK
ncbi:MAG: hypothetical protein QXY18_00995 [Nitrososphaerota archaeon]